MAVTEFRSIKQWQCCIQLPPKCIGINHQILRLAGMNRGAFDGHRCLRSVKGFIFNLARIAIVQSVGKISRKSLGIKFIRTSPDFFIRAEAEFDQAMLHFRMS